jgi:hypothetical protein
LHENASTAQTPGKSSSKYRRQTERPLRQEQGLYKNTTVVRNRVPQNNPLGGLLGAKKRGFFAKNRFGTETPNFRPFFGTPKNDVFSGFFGKIDNFPKKNRFFKNQKNRF